MNEAAAGSLLDDLFRILGRSLEYPQGNWPDGDYLAWLDGLLAELGWEEERAELRDLPADHVELLDVLQIEYTRLFINAVPTAVAPPYGSVHYPGEGMLNNRSTEKTREFYRRHGFDLAEESGPADYLPLELEFLARLAGSGRETEAEVFLSNYFRPWFSAFRARVLAGALLPFYRILIELIDFFTQQEDKYEN
ncbi:MAG: molecular chaperone TorD family protein [Deltaproteobacteria bacterium]|jgi:TorA maturation chaperone TorD